MRVCLYEDRAASLEPLSLTRPVFDLVCGLTSLGDKLARYFAAASVGVIVRPHLAEVYRRQHPDRPANDPQWLGLGETILVNGCWLPPAPTMCRKLDHGLALLDGVVAYAVLYGDLLQHADVDHLSDWLDSLQHSLPVWDAGGQWIKYPWDLVENNGRQLTADFPGVVDGPQADLSQLTVIGPRDQLFVDPRAHIEPLVVADTRPGPIVIEREAVLSAFTRVEGPCYIGPYCRIGGAKIRGSTLGPHCRIGGEIEASIIQGYSNKYHDGFLGHSYLGEWVNLGAGTQSSDLRNDYGIVTVMNAGQPVPTGLNKVGCFLGDHTKTGLGTLLNTGTSAGIFCQILPAGPLAPRYLPSFTSWWNGRLREAADWNQLFNTAQVVMHRRGQTLSEEQEQLYRQIFAETALIRRRTLQTADRHAYRQSA